MYTRESLHIRLKHFRNLKGLSQTEVAEKLGLSRQAISNWEANKSYPDLDNIVLLSKLYDVSVDELLGANTTENTKDNQPPQNEILQNSSQTVLEMICLAAILVLTCQFTIIGMLAAIIITVWLKKTQRPYKIIYLLCIVCFCISTYNLYVLIEHTFKLGVASIESV